MNSNDTKLLIRLMEKGRSSWAELGGLIGLTAPAAADRVRKLEESGVIRGYAARVNPEEVGCGLGALVSVTLERTDARGAFLELIQSMPEVLECHHVAGSEDFILKIRCADTRALEQVISERIKKLDGIRTRTTVILSTVKETPVLPVRME
ncbi:MAG: Lrp/AsnC family transcriptional regulator [Synergistales bacterium]|jgi:Lrp/AsnC family leucine-responsive transcriptional regulator